VNQPLSGRKIGLLTASASRLGGGVFEAVVTQAELIRSLGGEAPVFALTDLHSTTDSARFASGSLHCSEVRGPGQIGFAPGLIAALVAADLDCLHLHGIWMYPSLAGTRWAKRTGRPYVVSPHGMLDPWITARGRWKKALARLGYERSSWHTATALHALTAREAEDIRRESGRDDSLIIPNAGPACSVLSAAPRDAEIVYIGRIHPKKNLLALIAGWTAASLPKGSQLTLAGWGDMDHVAELEVAVAAAGPTVEFVGPVYGDAKRALLERARFTILPSLSEGLPMAILEGWAAGTPSIMTAQCNLPEGFAAEAALECGWTEGEITVALKKALAFDWPDWSGMARAAQDLAAGQFSAPAIAARWADAYLGAIGARQTQ
jgi:glycosyltransferase involved in cell wall biosynthesis